MKNFKELLYFTIIALFLSSCSSTTAKFPVSSLTPAAEISAKMKQNKNKNFEIKVTAINMASADRLTPAKKIYIVWIVTESNGVKNVGQLIHENAEKASLETSTPFNVEEIFITAEEQGNISTPQGIEISRTRFKSK